VFVIVPSYLGTIIAKLLKGRLIGSTENRRVILEKKRDFGEVDEIGGVSNVREFDQHQNCLVARNFPT
jgi:hypothetical protein